MKGTIKNKRGETLPFCNIFISDANGNILNSNSPIPTEWLSSHIGSAARGTQSDIAGNYDLQAGSAKYITASFVGYISQTKEIGAAETLNFTLEEKTNALPIVEIFGKTEKKSYTKYIAILVLAALVVAIYFYIKKRKK